MLMDTHLHLYAPEFLDDIDEVIKKAHSQGVTVFVLPNIDAQSIEPMNTLCAKYKNFFPLMGLHPCYVKEDYQEQLALIKQELFNSNNKYFGVGEIGIDLYWDKTFLNQQREVFKTQITWAKQKQLPIVIHARDSFDEIFEIMDQENDENLKGIFHCFTGTLAQAHKIIEYGGFKLGIGGVVTFKKSGVDEVVKQLDLQHLVLETDSPYLAPVPFRGKRNEPAYLPFIAQKVCEIKNESIETISEITSKNAQQIFQLF